MVREVAEGIVVLTAADEPSDLRRDGTFGLEWQDGYGRAGKVLDLHYDRVVREFQPVKGSLKPGTEARLDSFAFDGDPSSRALPFTEVTISTPLGPAPAWQVPGSGDTWAVIVHGKGSSREEALRILPTLRDVGLSSLTISYRNDAGAPASPDGRYGEWQDVAAAMDYARGQGARRFVLVGYSIGGAIVMATLAQPQYAAQIAGVILDGPVLDLRRTVEFRAGLRNSPGPLTYLFIEVAARRYDIDWGKYDYLDDADSLDTPVLLFHGDADRVVPVSTSDELAQRRGDIVTYMRLEGVGHVRAWNADPLAYEAAVRDFIAKLGR